MGLFRIRILLLIQKFFKISEIFNNLGIRSNFQKNPKILFSINSSISAVVMFIAIGLGLFEFIREVTEPDNTAIGNGLCLEIK